MSTRSKSVGAKSKKSPEVKRPRSLEFAQKGIRTGGDFAGMMSALMSDIIEGSVSPQVGNATVNAGSKLLKVVELQLKYGKPTDGMPRGTFLLVDEAQAAIA